jgi:P-type Cu+ transporter
MAIEPGDRTELTLLDDAGPVTSAASPSLVLDGTHERVELAVGGMTCASCANRVEKRLNQLDGVTATVNIATEKATVAYPASLQVADLIAAVEETGYTAEALHVEPPQGETRGEGPGTSAGSSDTDS